MSADDRLGTGLQAERTLLAWRRTALSLAVVSAAGIRFTVPVIGWAAVPLGAVGIVLALLSYVAAGERYRHSTATPPRRLPDGWAPAATAAATVLLGVSALVFSASRL